MPEADAVGHDPERDQELVRVALDRLHAVEEIRDIFPVLATSMDRLAASLEHVATKDDVRNASTDQDQKRRRDRILGVLVALFVLVAAAVPSVFSYRSNVRSTDSSAEARQTRREIAECTTPSPPEGQAISTDDAVHECYEASRKETGVALGSIGNAILDAAICATQNRAPEAIQACFAERQKSHVLIAPGGPQ